MLSTTDLNILRFKIAKLLKTKESRIKQIDISLDDTVLVHTGFGFFPISFKSVNEINSEFKKYFPNAKIPLKFSVKSSNNTDFVSLNVVKTLKKNKHGLPILDNNLGLKVINK